jgi:hypothetical protein
MKLFVPRSSWLTLTAAVAALLAGAPGAVRAEGPLYEITKTEPKVASGGKGTAAVTIATKNGWHVNAEAPITVALTPPAGIAVSKVKLSRGDLAQSTMVSARFDIPFEATEAGQKVISAEARFVICQESACKPVKETLALNIEVTPAVIGKPKKK